MTIPPNGSESVGTLQIADVDRASRSPVEYKSDGTKIGWVHTTLDEPLDGKPQRLHQEARRLLRQVEAKPLDVHVPALLLYEVGNILLLKTDLDAGSLDQAIDDLEAPPFIVAPPATPLLKRAARVGKQFNLTFYDASFLALAVELDCPLITADGLFRTRPFSSTRPASFQSWQSVRSDK